VNPETPKDTTPEVPVQTAAPSPFPAQTTVEQQTSPELDPPKKSRKKLLIGIIIAAVVLIGGALAAFLTINSITSQAKEAATTYTKAAEEHVTKLIEVKVFKDRLDNYDTRPTLAKVNMGETFSKEYKDAIALETRYNKLLDDTKSAVAERYATLELSPFFKEFAVKLATKLDTSSLTITDDASVANARQYVKSMETKASDYTALANRYKSYVYAEKYRDYQTKAAEALDNMGKSWGELAKVTTTYIDLSEKFIAVEKSGDEDAAKKLEAEVSTSSKEVQSKTTQINADYKDYTKILGDNNRLLVNTMVADDYLNKAYEESGKVLDLLTEFQKSFKK